MTPPMNKQPAADNIARIAGELAAVEKRIAHIDWLLSPSRAMMPLGVAELATERDMLAYQTRGNLLVDLRQAMAGMCK